MKADINVTPLIDVLLVLLIIFMVVAPVAPRALDASLPDKRGPTLEPPRTGLVLEVRADDFSLNSAPVLTLQDLDGRLRAAFETRRDATLFVRPAADISYSRLVAALDVATGAGASRIGIVDEDTEQPVR
jgi:biopolymer transport protein ExbD